jgi:hypothetical protein
VSNLLDTPTKIIRTPSTGQCEERWIDAIETSGMFGVQPIVRKTTTYGEIG